MNGLMRVNMAWAIRAAWAGSVWWICSRADPAVNSGCQQVSYIPVGHLWSALGLCWADCFTAPWEADSSVSVVGGKSPPVCYGG